MSLQINKMYLLIFMVNRALGAMEMASVDGGTGASSEGVSAAESPRAMLATVFSGTCKRKAGFDSEEGLTSERFAEYCAELKESLRRARAKLHRGRAAVVRLVPRK